jgi:hypothetical protein
MKRLTLEIGHVQSWIPAVQYFSAVGGTSSTCWL